jgi:tRNA-Thr(GGU) m(6)t(6)A37 methyltransferase TsaA
MPITYESIGVIHSPYIQLSDMPIQPAGASGVQGSLEIFPGYEPALKDVDGFSHLILLYHFHRVSQYKLEVIPFLDAEPHGLFATRAPQRPNAIGLSVVRLLSVQGCILNIENVDILDGTPLLDIKPYVPGFDGNISGLRLGWLEKKATSAKSQRSDDRFK